MCRKQTDDFGYVAVVLTASPFVAGLREPKSKQQHANIKKLARLADLLVGMQRPKLNRPSQAKHTKKLNRSSFQRNRVAKSCRERHGLGGRTDCQVIWGL